MLGSCGSRADSAQVDAVQATSDADGDRGRGRVRRLLAAAARRLRHPVQPRPVGVRLAGRRQDTVHLSRLRQQLSQSVPLRVPVSQLPAQCRPPCLRRQPAR